MHTIHIGNCLDHLRLMPEASIDAIVTDPPYGLSFMGKRWDYDVPSVEIWAECLRVLKPGGHLLAFAGTRTQHRMACRIEDAGFEIRDLIAWVYGSGFPKSLDVSKAIDKAAGAEREVIGPNRYAANHPNPRGMAVGQNYGTDMNPCRPETAPATEAARQWQGWGTALKPALEPITVARKPLVGTVAENVLAHGTGALNIDGCRVATDEAITATRNIALGSSASGVYGAATAPDIYEQKPGGRFPANLIHDGSDEVAGMFPGDEGKSAARFYYCPKASRKDRGTGNGHPTVKPTDLMRYLCRLVTPPGGVVLDPFMGSGSTGKAAVLEGFRFIGCEMSEDYARIAEARIAAAGE